MDAVPVRPNPARDLDHAAQPHAVLRIAPYERSRALPDPAVAQPPHKNTPESPAHTRCARPPGAPVSRSPRALPIPEVRTGAHPALRRADVRRDALASRSI